MAASIGLHIDHRDDGSTIVRSGSPLLPYPERVTERLEHWAERTPDAPFLAERAGAAWSRISYGETLDAVRAIAHALLQRDVSAERPVLILSGNSIDHALLGLACLHVGIPYAPISVAYSLASADWGKLRQIVAFTTPGLVFAAGAEFAHGAPVLAASDATERRRRSPTLRRCTAARPRQAVRGGGIRDGRPATAIAKLLFTSGSTGSPKAVINTHRMLCSNQAMIASRSSTFLAGSLPILVDWLPWSHTFGGNHNFNLVLFHGGTLFIDAGAAAAGPVRGNRARRLREIAAHLASRRAQGVGRTGAPVTCVADPALNRHFHSRLRVPFYAAASLAAAAVGPNWRRLSRAGDRDASIPMITGLGSTETAPMAI